MSINGSAQIPLLDLPSQRSKPGIFLRATQAEKTSCSFVNNMGLPVHRWFRYSAGFSAAWVRQVLKEEYLRGKRTVIDPFVGSGTVLLEAEANGYTAIGVESHPFVSRIAKAKMLWRENPLHLAKVARSVLQKARTIRTDVSKYCALVQKCFSHEFLSKLDALRCTYESERTDDPVFELVWLAITSILRNCSHVGTAQWQYILPRKTKAKVLEPLEAFLNKIDLLCNDMTVQQSFCKGPRPNLYTTDIRNCPEIPENWADLLITSPPYANNYDYADATRLELSFWGEVESWGDLHNKIRKHLIVSCTQHAATLRAEWKQLIKDPLLGPITDEIDRACTLLNNEKHKHGGKKQYDAMIASYFHDLARTWHVLRKIMRRDSRVCFVIGDSAPYGVYVPVHEWLGKLALAAGFRSYSFEKIRDRNTKWKNRKHRVPLNEGRLWVQG